jgi:putative hydrolase of HD superfamily
MSALKKVAFFLMLAGRLKKERRMGWIEKIGIPVPESVADHTFGTVLISMLMGDLKGLDTCRMMRMALIHDLAEALTGDIVSKGRGEEKGKRLKEDESMNEILLHLPKNLQNLYRELWRDWLESGSIEAKMVQQIDKLEMALQASEYQNEGYPRNKLEEFKHSALEKITDKDLLELIPFFEIFF